MLFICCLYVFYVTYMFFICYLYVFYILFICCLYVFYMFYMLFICFLCFLYVFYMFFICFYIFLSVFNMFLSALRSPTCPPTDGGAVGDEVRAGLAGRAWRGAAGARRGAVGAAVGSGRELEKQRKTLFINYTNIY